LLRRGDNRWQRSHDSHTQGSVVQGITNHLQQEYVTSEFYATVL